MLYKNLTDFQLNAFFQHVPEIGKAMETGYELDGIFNWFDAKVPGSVHGALLANGLISDPYYGMQSMESEWVKDRWWVYKTKFSMGEELKGRNIRLRINAIDYKGLVSLNRVKLDEHEGMYVPIVKNITDLLSFDSENHLSVMLYNAPDEMGQIGYTNRTFTQKARFSYKWDWCPRLVQLGIYDEVAIESFGSAAIDYADIKPLLKNGEWRLENSFEIEAFEATDIKAVLELSYQNKTIACQEIAKSFAKGKNSFDISFDVEKPELWWPNGWGEQPLYDLSVKIYDENGLSDENEYQVGFRTLDYVKCDDAPENSLTYSPIVNGKQIYIKGVNYTPVDMMYGDVTKTAYTRVLERAAEANINLVRVWGGGLIEKEDFYRECDRLGLMVWQEFIQSSSGISNIPSKKPEFLKLAAATAEEAVKVKRNHVSLTFWSGGNELTDDKFVPSTFQDENIAMLKNIKEQHDDMRLMLPTSASGPLEFLDVSKPGQNHDVHGPWKFLGIKSHYETFNLSDSLLHSEFGIDGVGNYETIASTVHPKDLYAANMRENVVWRHRGEMWDTYAREVEIFGPFSKDKEDLFNFIACSQFTQGEALKYALEANRRRKFKNCGSIIWQLNEPWPGISGTNIIDYYCVPKFAYHTTKNAFRNVNPSLKFEKLVFDKGEEIKASIFVSNDFEEFKDDVCYQIFDSCGNLVTEEKINDVTIPENRSVKLRDISLEMPDSEGIIIVLKLERKAVENRYCLLAKNQDGFASPLFVKRYCKSYISDLGN